MEHLRRVLKPPIEDCADAALVARPPQTQSEIPSALCHARMASTSGGGFASALASSNISSSDAKPSSALRSRGAGSAGPGSPSGLGRPSGATLAPVEGSRRGATAGEQSGPPRPSPHLIFMAGNYRPRVRGLTSRINGPPGDHPGPTTRELFPFNFPIIILIKSITTDYREGPHHPGPHHPGPPGKLFPLIPGR